MIHPIPPPPPPSFRFIARDVGAMGGDGSVDEMVRGEHLSGQPLLYGGKGSFYYGAVFSLSFW